MSSKQKNIQSFHTLCIDEKENVICAKTLYVDTETNNIH